jgi:hypothetical protein
VIYLYGYFAIGVMVLVVMFVSHRITKSSGDDRQHDFRLKRDARSGRGWWVLNKVGMPILVAVFAVFAWPVPVYWKAKDLLSGSRKTQPPDAREFRLCAEDLQQCMTI